MSSYLTAQQFKHVSEKFCQLDAQEYINLLYKQSVDPMVELAFLCTLGRKNLLLFYFTNQVMQKKFAFTDEQADPQDQVCLILKGNEFEVVHEQAILSNKELVQIIHEKVSLVALTI